MKSRARGAKQVNHIYLAMWNEDLKWVLEPWLILTAVISLFALVIST